MFGLKMSDRERNLLTAALVCAVFYGFQQFLLQPKLGTLAAQGGKLKQTRLELESAEKKLETLAGIEQQLQIKETAKVKPVLAREKSLEVLQLLARTISDSELSLLAIKPGTFEGATGYKFDVACAGSYQQLYRFLQILYGLESLVLIDTMTINGEAATSPNLDIKMLLTVHY